MRLRSLVLLGVLVGCSKLTAPPAPEPIASDTPVTAAAQPAANASGKPMPQPPAAGEDVKIEDIVVGTGPEVHPGDVVSMHYTGMLLDGTKFDSSHDHPGNQPLVTPIPGRLIQGWNKGIPGMHVGGRRKLTIPPSLGYGAQGSPPKIPPNATLVFDLELVDRKPAAQAGGSALPPPLALPRPQRPQH